MSTENVPGQFEDSPEGWARRWHFELKKAREALADFYKAAQAADEAARDESTDRGGRRLCLYASTTQILGDMLFGRTPQASVSRKFADSDDDEARVASEMLERVLNCDIQRADDTFAEATKSAMVDWLNTGLGVQWHRYEPGEEEVIPGEPAIVDPMTGQETVPAVPEQVSRPNERVNTDYVHFKDFLWGQCKTWDQVPWVARRVQMSKEKLAERFNKTNDKGEVEEDIAAGIPLNSKQTTPEEDKHSEHQHPWDRADVWEIWHKETRKAYWVVEGYPKLLDSKEDPLQLSAFFPCQKPLIDNPTNSKLVPIPRFKFIQDLENNINKATTRIDKLVDGAKLSGLYAKEMGPIVQKMLKGAEAELHPVDEWAMFAEKGGIAGAILWLPLQEIVATIGVLSNQRREDMDLMYQVEGQSDLIRGQQTQNGTPGEAKIKAKSASVRIQARKDEIARFASDGQRIRSEIISRQFEPQTIIRHSNIERTPDAPFAQKAVELLQSRFSDYRIEIKPEAINLTDFTALKAERMETLDGIAGFFQRVGPVVQMLGPQAMELAMEMLKVTLAGIKGGSAYESLIDQHLAKLKQAQEAAAANPQPPPPDPKILAQQMKGQQDLAKVQAELDADIQRAQVDVQADAQREQNQMLFNVKEHQAKTQISAAFKPPTPPNGRPQR